MKLDELAGKRVVLLGLGADVTAAVGAIKAAGPSDLAVVDDGPAAQSTELPVLSLADAAVWGDVFVRSPGFPRYQEPLTDAVGRGARVTTPLDLWLGTYGPERTVVAITGTKGKSTVTALLGTLAERGHIEVGVAGNLGVPVFSNDWNSAAPVIILEISSYQAADLHHVPDIAVLTYLSEDHLSWHGGVGRYVADKLKVISNDGGQAGVVLIAEAGGRAADALDALGIEAQVISAPNADPSVPAHRVQNAALAAAALAELGGPRLVGVEVVALARHSMPGRLDPCPGPEGVLCVDDALASNPSATAAALGWLRGLGRPTVVILGGQNRDVDPAPLVQEAGRWDRGLLRAVTVPNNGRRLAELAGIELVGEAQDMAEATAKALALSPEGSVILFSPAAPTPGAVGNWETRSSQFRTAVAGAVTPTRSS